MNPPPSFNRRRLIITAVLVLAVITMLLVWAQSFVREVIVLPLSYLMYSIRIFTITTPEWIFWAVLLLILATVSFRSLSGKRAPLAPPPPELAELAYASTASGRVSFWQNKVMLMRRGSSRYYTTNFHATYGRLLLSVLSHRYRLTIREVEDHLYEGTIDVPDFVREYALFSMQRAENHAPSFLQSLWQSIMDALKSLFSFRRADAAPTAGDDPRVAAILKYIEDELEVSHGNSGR